MARPSEPVLNWLRTLIDRRGLNAAAVAKLTDLPKGRVRRALAGAEPMNLDELVAITNALQVAPSDMGLAEPGLADAAPTDTALADTALAAAPSEESAAEAPPAPPPGFDPWGNQVEQLFRVAFALGCDFHFVVDPTQLQDSGVPRHVLSGYQGRPMLLDMKAEYHPYNNARYDDGGITLTLSFDALYECRFPWACVRQIGFAPQFESARAGAEPDPEPERPKAPHLRLVD